MRGIDWVGHAHATDQNAIAVLRELIIMLTHEHERTGMLGVKLAVLDDTFGNMPNTGSCKTRQAPCWAKSSEI